MSTRFHRPARRVLLVVAFVGFALTTMAGAAHAQGDPPNATGPCQARAVLSNGVVIDPYASSGVFEIPLSGTAEYTGSITGPVPPRPINGEVYIEGPLGRKISITDEWTWSDDSSDKLAKTGTVDWDLPSWLPRGTELTVKGVHEDAGFRCAGSVVVRLEGGFFDSPIGAVSLVGTALSAAGLLAALFAKSAAASPGGVA